MKSSLILLFKLVSYNIKVIFANKFIYFVLASFAFFAFIITITVFEDPDVRVSRGTGERDDAFV